MSIKKNILKVFFIFLFLIFPNVSFASAKDTIHSKQNILFNLLTKPRSSLRNQQIKHLFDDLINYDHLSCSLLEYQWDKLNDFQKSEFKKVIKKIIEINYYNFNDKILKFKIYYLEELNINSDTIVKINANNGKFSVNIDFVMRQFNRKWHIMDIIIEDVSIAESFKHRFLNIIQMHGFDSLIKMLNTYVLSRSS